MANRKQPEELAVGDLDAITEELAGIYFSGVLVSYLTCVFMNSAYVQPGMKDEGKAVYKERPQSLPSGATA